MTLNGNAPPVASGAVPVAPGQSDLALGLAASSLSGLSSAYAGARQGASAVETRLVKVTGLQHMRACLVLLTWSLSGWSAASRPGIRPRCLASCVAI